MSEEQKNLIPQFVLPLLMNEKYGNKSRENIEDLEKD